MENSKYLRLLAEKYPTMRSLSREIINLTAILNLPKGTEHFMSDIHGEYEAFCHILNNCAGVIREKADMLYSEKLSDREIEEICTIIYYPREKLSRIKKDRVISSDRYRLIINRMIEIAAVLSSKYTRSKVRKAMPADYAYIIDELIHAQNDEDDNQIRYHERILDSIIGIDADDFITALAGLIKRLAVDHLHIVGDIFDRGASADKIIDLLMKHHSLDIQWGNHDILWMGAAAGNDACIANAVRNSIKYNTLLTLESGYGISLRDLTVFAGNTYTKGSPMEKALRAITVIQFKAEGQTILRHPEYDMKNRLLLDKINTENGTVCIDGKDYPLNDSELPTIMKESPYSYTQEERDIISGLRSAFLNSTVLQKHMNFLLQKGSMYKCINGSLLYHGCIPLDEEGNFFNLDWAVDPVSRQSVQLSHADFFRVYTALNQVCGWLGETSSEVTGAEDLHLEASCDFQTGIKMYSPTSNVESTTVYNLHGQAMSPSAHRPAGIYIVNGKKIIINHQ